jgi:hypothetical protein
MADERSQVHSVLLIAFRTACRLRPAGARALRNATLTLLWRLGFKPVEGFEHFAEHRQAAIDTVSGKRTE